MSCAGVGEAQGTMSPGATKKTAPALATAVDSAKARALLTKQLPCLGCHTLNGDGGRIGPDLSTVRTRRDPAYIAAMIADPQRVVPGSLMPKTLMPRGTRSLLLKFFAGVDAEAQFSSTAATPAPARAPNGAALYATWCATCHGAAGNGDGPNAKYLPVPPLRHNDATAMQAKSDDQLYDGIAAGGGVMGRSPRMPAFGATLAPTEIRALVAHLRSLCRCSGPAWASGAR